MYGSDQTEVSEESLVDRITRVTRELGGEAQLRDIRSRVLRELGEPDSRSSRHYQSVSLTIFNHSEGRGGGRFIRVGRGRIRLADEWLKRLSLDGDW